MTHEQAISIIRNGEGAILSELIRLDKANKESLDHIGRLQTLVESGVSTMLANQKLARVLHLNLETATSLLEAIADKNECVLDHHGYCQAHSLHKAPCPHGKAINFIAHIKSDKNKLEVYE